MKKFAKIFGVAVLAAAMVSMVSCSKKKAESSPMDGIDTASMEKYDLYNLENDMTPGTWDCYMKKGSKTTSFDVVISEDKKVKMVMDGEEIPTSIGELRKELYNEISDIAHLDPATSSNMDFKINKDKTIVALNGSKKDYNGNTVELQIKIAKR